MIATQLDIGFALRGGKTVLSRRVFRWPFMVMRPFHLDSTPVHMATVIVQSTSGALQRRDNLRQRYCVGQGAAAYVTTQGAGPVHDAMGELGMTEAISLSVGEGGYLEYLPEPRLLFANADLDSRLDLDCAASGAAIISDAFTWREAGIARPGFRRLRSTTSVSVDGGKPILIDRMDVRGADPRDPRFHAFGAMTLIAPGRVRIALVDHLNAALMPLEGLYAGASLTPGTGVGLGIRFAGRDLRAVRAGLAISWSLARVALFGVPPGRRRKD